MNPFRAFWTFLKAVWDVLRTVYWYNSLPWRILKSGALVVLGFFCLSGANLVYSYKPEWKFLLYIISYGFLLIPYGPIHHLLVIPVSLKLSHYDWGRTLRLGKRIPFWTLIGFFGVVLYFGYQPLEIMTFKFKAPQLTRSHDVNPEITCWRTGEADAQSIHCELPTLEAIARVEVENKGRTILTDEQPPYRFTLDVNELEEVVGQRNFHVVLKDKDGYMIRRYVRSAGMIEERTSSDTGPVE
jgi:hypothetical protein